MIYNFGRFFYKFKKDIDPYRKDADFSEIDEESLQKTDVCICFTQPAAALENIEKIASLKKKIVMATTGWEDKLEQAKKNHPAK